MKKEFDKDELAMIWVLLAEQMDKVRAIYEGTDPFEESAIYWHIRQAILKTAAQYEALDAKEAPLMEDCERALIVKTIMEELDRLEAGIAGLENDICDEDTDVNMAWLSFGELSGMEYAIKRIYVYGLDSAGKAELYDRIRQADKARDRIFTELLKVTYEGK